jgi:hypothetical protein
MVLTLGKLPDRWWTKWEDRSLYFDENGTFIGDRTKLPPVSGKFLKIPPDRMEPKELEELERVIRMMVSYGVMDRISAAEVVQLTPESWMKSSHKGVVSMPGQSTSGDVRYLRQDVKSLVIDRS